MSREALLKLFAVPPPTIEEILEQERQEKGLTKEEFSLIEPSFDLNGPLSQKKKSKRKLSDPEGSNTSSTSSKKTKNNVNNNSSNNEKCNDVEGFLDEAITKNSKPSATAVSPTNTVARPVISPVSPRKLTDPRRNNTTSATNNTSLNINEKRKEVEGLLDDVTTKKLKPSSAVSPVNTSTVAIPITSPVSARKLTDPRRRTTASTINKNISNNSDICNTSPHIINKRHNEIESLFTEVTTTELKPPAKVSPINTSTVVTPVTSPVSEPVSISPLSPSLLSPGEFFSLDSILTAVKMNNKQSIPVVTAMPAPASNMPSITEVLPSPRPNTPPYLMRSPSPPYALPPPYPQRPSVPEINAPGNANLPKKKKRNRKNKKAQMATRNHEDHPKVTEEVDFDTLLKKHEMATAKSKEKELKNALNTASSSNKDNTQSSPLANTLKQQVNSMDKRGTVPPKNNNLKKTDDNKNKAQKKFVPKLPCVFFAKGFCKNGDACTFKHEAEVAPPPPPPPPPTIICQFFKTGSCIQGYDCKFSHNLKLEPCRFFHMKGTCEQEENCPYSHDPLNEDSLARLRALTGPCRFYHFKGYCNSGDACLFSHDEPTEEEKKAVEAEILPCRFYHLTKNCKKGDDCFYLHDEATEEQIKNLK